MQLLKRGKTNPHKAAETTYACSCKVQPPKENTHTHTQCNCKNKIKLYYFFCKRTSGRQLEQTIHQTIMFECQREKIKQINLWK
jgi:hypothetical protein